MAQKIASRYGWARSIKSSPAASQHKKVVASEEPIVGVDVVVEPVVVPVPVVSAVAVDVLNVLIAVVVLPDSYYAPPKPPSIDPPDGRIFKIESNLVYIIP